VSTNVTPPTFARQERKGRRRNPKKEEGLFVEVLEEDTAEEDGISTRQDSSTFIPPLTKELLSWEHRHQIEADS
jgi:hypothetical protein